MAKNVSNLIKFLAVILILTLVARGTSGATLPKVDVTNPQAADITEAVSGTATVVSAGSIDLCAPEGLQVEEMLVGVGQKVSIGDMVAVFDADDVSDALIRQSSQLDSLNLRLSKLGRGEEADRSALENAQKNYDKAQSDYDTAKGKQKKLPSVKDAKKAVKDAEANEKLKKEEFDAAPDDEALEQAWQDAVQKLDKAKAVLADAQKAASDVSSAADRLDDAGASLSRAEADYEKAKQQVSDASAQNRIDASVLRLDIEKQKELVRKLESLSETGGQFFSEAEGIVSMAVDEGRKTDANAVVRLTDGTGGTKAEMTLESGDAEKLAVGDECMVAYGSGMYYRPSASAAVFAIAPPDERDNVKVTLLLPEGDWTKGQRLDAQVIISRVSYGQCVPLTALHSDNSGYFVYVVTEKKTVLGIENVLTRTPVNLKAKDDSNAAVEGPVGSDDNVVTGSNKNIDDGSRVRIKQEG